MTMEERLNDARAKLARADAPRIEANRRLSLVDLDTGEIHAIDYLQTIEALLIDERCRVLMGIKPDSKARSTWNRSIQAIADSFPEYQDKARILQFLLEVTI